MPCDQAAQVGCREGVLTRVDLELGVEGGWGGAVAQIQPEGLGVRGWRVGAQGRAWGAEGSAPEAAGVGEDSGALWVAMAALGLWQALETRLGRKR